MTLRLRLVLALVALVSIGLGVFVVRDHGPGLDSVALEHALDRFWQANEARTGASTGLGLSIVAAVVAEQRGSTTAGNADGGGAVFTLHIPTS